MLSDDIFAFFYVVAVGSGAERALSPRVPIRIFAQAVRKIQDHLAVAARDRLVKHPIQMLGNIFRGDGRGILHGRGKRGVYPYVLILGGKKKILLCAGQGLFALLNLFSSDVPIIHGESLSSRDFFGHMGGSFSFYLGVGGVLREIGI